MTRLHRVQSAIAVLVCSLATGCATIGPGQVGVLWTAGGGTQPERYGEGIHAVSGWDEMYIYDLRSMSHDEVLTVIAVNGLAIKLDTSVRYHLIPSQIVKLHQEIGPEYYNKIVEPVLRSEARRVFGQYTPEEIYSTRRELIEREIRGGVTEKIDGKHIALEAILIRNVELPEAIRNAIGQKLAAEQDVLRMQYVLQVAKATAEQRQIEAKAIADSNKTIAASLSPAVLEFERIQEIGKLAESANAKTVLLGPGAGSTPLMVSAPGPGQ